VIHRILRGKEGVELCEGRIKKKIQKKSERNFKVKQGGEQGGERTKRTATKTLRAKEKNFLAA